MPDLPAIPAALVEAAARALADEMAKVTHVCEHSVLVEYSPIARVALAAALAECEVREEYACPDGDGGLGWHTYRCPDVTDHRFVATLPASPVDTPREDRRT